MIIEVKVIANSSQNCVVGFEGDVLKVKCTAVPEKGKANAAVINILSKYYKVPKRDITILKGTSNSRKTVEVLLRA